MPLAENIIGGVLIDTSPATDDVTWRTVFSTCTTVSVVEIIIHIQVEGLYVNKIYALNILRLLILMLDLASSKIVLPIKYVKLDMIIK